MKIRRNDDSVSLFTLLEECEGYTVSSLRQDILAAFTVAMLALPQSMAYSLVANLPPSVGLFSAIFATIFAAGFGSSKHLVVGPSNAIAILIQAACAEVLHVHYREVVGIERNILSIHIVTQLSFVTGILQILAGTLRLGRLTQFVSRSVVVGYLFGVALFVMIHQMIYFLGIPRPLGHETLYAKLWFTLKHLHMIHYPTLVVGIFSIFSLIFVGKKYPRLPNALIMLFLVGSLVHILGLSPQDVKGVFEQEFEEKLLKVSLVQDFGQVHLTQPRLYTPFFDMRIMSDLLPFSFAIALLGILEASSISKSIAAKTGQRLSINQEILGLGIGNFFSSFFAAMPSSGSPSRSTLNYASGAETRFSSIFSGLFVGAIVFVLGPFVTHIPLAALAALLLLTAFRMIDIGQIKLCLRATRGDAAVMVTTVLSCLFFTLDISFYIGIVLSIVLYLREASSPYLVEFAYDSQGRKVLEDKKEVFYTSPIRVINVEGELFFGAADIFQEALKTVADNKNVRVIILHVKNAHHIDATACWAFEQLSDYLSKTGRFLVASGLRRQVWKALCQSKLTAKIGKDNLFLFEDQEPSRCSVLALEQACHLAKRFEDKS